MANELNFYGTLEQTGLTVIAKVYDNTGSQVGPDINCTEVGSLSIYIGDMPVTVLGQYGVRFINSSDGSLLGQGFINWDGTKEMELGLSQIQTDISALNNLSAADVVASVPTTAEIEAALLNEGDGQQLIDALVVAIGNTNIDEVSLIAALRADLERTGGALDIIDGLVDSIKTRVDSLNDISVTDVEGSNLAKEVTLSNVVTSIAAIPTTDSVADLTPVLTALSNLNDPTVTEIRAAFDEAEFKDKNIESEIHSWLDSYTNKDDYKGGATDLTQVLTNQGVINEGVKKASLIIPHTQDI